MKYYVIQYDQLSPNFGIFQIEAEDYDKALEIVEDEIQDTHAVEWILEEDQFIALKAKMNQV